MFYLFRVWLPLSFVSLKIVFIKSIVSILVDTNCFAINQLISYCKTLCLSQISIVNLGQIRISLITSVQITQTTALFKANIPLTLEQQTIVLFPSAKPAVAAKI